MKTFRSTLFLLLAICPCLLLKAQQKKLGVAPVTISKSIETSTAAQNSDISLRRVAEALDGQFISSIQNTRKFQVFARSDLTSLQQEGGFTGTGLAGISDVDYLLVASIDDFQDITESVTFSGLGQTAERRTIRLGLVAKIYEATTGKLLESANLQLSNFDANQVLANASSAGGSATDALIRQLAEQLALKAAQRVTDVIYPAKVIAKTGSTVTINRGDGSDIATGQLWEVFAVGEELLDPDTGVSLGREEVSVGKVRVTRVTPKFSQATISGEDLGIDRGAIVRRVTE